MPIWPCALRRGNWCVEPCCQTQHRAISRRLHAATDPRQAELGREQLGIDGDIAVCGGDRCLRVQGSSQCGAGDSALHRHRLARGEVDAELVELLQQQRRPARETARIGRLSLPTDVAFQMLIRRAGAEGKFAALRRHLAEHALQGVGEVAADAGG